MKELFSPTENKVLKILGRRKLTITEIREKFYEDEKEEPLNPNNVISSVVNRINKKVEYHNLDWFINGVGLGRGGKTVWKDQN